ncbi:MAG TPA: ABC transporter ATP-binding protein [Casimicrobiaceae bacterium]|jgi:NitT/TauT family transport system ATP-binding protein|nr:ABC transporter ATP-binding protein [Casimicrobiaceae bacterium]
MAGAAVEPAKPRARTLIRARGVAKSYRTGDGEVESLRPLEFEVGEGEFVSVVGPSGCGKSTLLKLIAGLLPASGGSIEIGGSTVDGPPPGIGIVFQSHVLLPWRTVLANILLQAEVRGLPREQSVTRARELVAMVGLEGFENKFPWQLSGGMQQRASICRALVHDPAILLMDEPFGALDAMTREKMNLELQRIWAAAKKTVLLITHSIPESIFLSDRVLVMSERPGSIAAIYEVALPRPRTLSMMGSPEFAVLAQTIRAHFYSKGLLDV